MRDVCESFGATEQTKLANGESCCFTICACILGVLAKPTVYIAGDGISQFLPPLQTRLCARCVFAFHKKGMQVCRFNLAPSPARRTNTQSLRCESSSRVNPGKNNPGLFSTSGALGCQQCRALFAR